MIALLFPGLLLVVRVVRVVAPRRSDVVYGVVLLVVAQVEVWIFGSAGGGWRGAVTLSAIAVAASWRRAAPWTSAAAVVAGGFLEAVVTGKPGTATWAIAVMVAWFTLGALDERVRAYVALPVGVAITALITQPFSLNVFLAIVFTTFGVPWLLGTLRWRWLRAKHAELRAQEIAEAAVAAERLRLARELHDVVSHNVGMIAVQAGAGDVLLDRHPDQARESLRAIERGAREALVELRRLLGLLRASDPDPLLPEPGLAELDALVARVREAGLDVAVRVEGEPRPLARPADLAGYRIIQEGLTNALKHAGQCRVVVGLRYDEHAIHVEISDDGPGPAGDRNSDGYGLRGIAERVDALGGAFEAGPTSARGFRIAASLPAISA
jgi:signal transduction histidine kinase